MDSDPGRSLRRRLDLTPIAILSLPLPLHATIISQGKYWAVLVYVPNNLVAGDSSILNVDNANISLLGQLNHAPGEIILLVLLVM